MVQHKMKPPFAGPWEQADLSANEPEDWWIESSRPAIWDKISWRLRDSLLNARIVRLARSNLREFDPNELCEWRCWRYLGSGSFGAAAVFTKIDKLKDAANVVDEVVVKEMTVVKPGRLPKRNVPGFDDRYIQEEALIHSILGSYRSDNLIHLRDYKAIFPNLQVPDPNDPRYPQHRGPPPLAFMRFYLEYAPYGNLANLLARYKAFNRYLPELFLWHLFNSLAKAVLTLEQNDPGDDPHFVAHLDIKPENVLLGYESTKSRDPRLTGGLDGELVGYPSIKLADLGLAWKERKSKPISMQALGRRGTPSYYPPEMVVNDDDEPTDGQYGGDWTPPANKLNDNLTPEANVWGVGKVMYDAFSLSAAHHFDHFKARSRREYEYFGQKPIWDFATTPFLYDLHHSSSPYTKKLSDLIEKCMHVEPSRRPTAVELYEMTTVAMNECYAGSAAKLPFSVRSRKLYYRGNEINGMSLEEKNCGKTLEPDEYLELLNPANNDPEETQLEVYPEQIWEMCDREKLVADLKAHYRRQKKRTGRQFRFRRHIHQNQQRLKLRPRPQSIDVLDPDRELTYAGTADDEFFIRESRKTRGRPQKDRDSDSSSSSDDDDNQRPHGSRGTCHPKPARDNGSRERSQRPRFFPYVPYNRRDEAPERAWVYGSGQEHIMKFDPYLEKPTTQQEGAKSNGKRAADFFESPEKRSLGDDSEGHEERRPSKRQRFSKLPNVTEDLVALPMPVEGEEIVHPDLGT